MCVCVVFFSASNLLSYTSEVAFSYSELYVHLGTVMSHDSRKTAEAEKKTDMKREVFGSSKFSL